MQNSTSESVSDSNKAGLNLASPANQLTKETKAKANFSDYAEFRKTTSLSNMDSPQRLQERLERLRSFNQPYEQATPKRFTPYNPNNHTPTTNSMTPQSSKKELANFLSPTEPDPDYNNLTPPMKKDPPECKNNAFDTFTIPNTGGTKIRNYTIDDKGISVDHEDQQNFLSPDRPLPNMMQGEPDGIMLEAPFDQLRDELKDGKVQIHRIIIETIQKVPGSNVPLIEQRIVYPNFQRSMGDNAVDEMQIILEQHGTRSHSHVGSIQEILLTPSSSEKKLDIPWNEEPKSRESQGQLPKDKPLEKESETYLDLPRKAVSPKNDTKIEKNTQILENSKDKTTPSETATQGLKADKNLQAKSSNVSQSVAEEGKDTSTSGEKSENKSLSTEKIKKK